ncbi:hypothetical protein [Furfurilactobacillus curtus]|uniref:Uncharacterized protein n=1 Tax=Furfurilactobacillus curtus TaxID=1746200 RepID=A0ABQ5JNC1_9LACO
MKKDKFKPKPDATSATTPKRPGFLGKFMLLLSVAQLLMQLNELRKRWHGHA